MSPWVLSALILAVRKAAPRDCPASPVSPQIVNVRIWASGHWSTANRPGGSATAPIKAQRDLARVRPRLFIACVMSIPILTPTLRSAKKSSSPNGWEAHNFAIAASRSSSLRLTGETRSGLLGKRGILHRPFCPPRVKHIGRSNVPTRARVKMTDPLLHRI
jgi:hypothetical protein